MLYYCVPDGWILDKEQEYEECISAMMGQFVPAHALSHQCGT